MLEVLLHTWLGWLMPVSHEKLCCPSQAAAHASWKCPPLAFATASLTAGTSYHKTSQSILGHVPATRHMLAHQQRLADAE